jgi:hypothetical protein
MHFNPETKTYKLFSALYNGESVTASQAQHRFGIKNISAEVSRVRQAGYAVYANSRKAGNGVKVTEYAIGKPSRKLIAAGYKAMALGLV